MTNVEIICTFMEPHWKTRMPYAYPFNPAVMPTLDLDALHEVEARLTYAQWDGYGAAMASLVGRTAPNLLHASAEQKIKALAAVLRPVVEAAQKEKAAAE
jgi:hypothetical protein